MTFHVPAWIPCDPGAPPRLPAAGGPGGQVLALVATDAAVGGGWAAEACLDLARGWSEAGARVVLVDGGLEEPSLHLVVGGLPAEGLVDALRWGASMKRVAHRPEGSSFFAIAAGTPVADGPAVLEEAGWPALCAGFREAGVTLAVLVPARDACLGPVLKQAGAIVVLAAPGEALPVALRMSKAPVVAVVGRESPRPPHPGEIPADGEPRSDEPEPVPSPEDLKPEPVSGMEGLPPGFQDLTHGAETPGEAAPEPAASGPEAFDAGLDAPAAEPESSVAEPESSVAELEMPAVEREMPGLAQEPPAVEQEPPVFGLDAPAAELDMPAPDLERPAAGSDVPESDSEPPAPEPELYGDPVPTFEEIVEESEAAASTPWWASRRTLAGIAVLFLAVAGAVAAALLGYLRIPGLTPAEEPADTTPAQAARVAGPPATVTSAAAPFSVGLAAFQDEAAARAMVQDLAARVPGVLFVQVPATVDGQIVHRVLAGPAPDSAEALALGARIAQAAGLGAGDWVARWTPRAFELGEMSDEEAAVRRSQVLQGLGVPSYVLAVRYSDGSLRFRVYAGAYADEAEATYLSGLLQERGLSGATLSDRIGHLPE